MEQSSKIPSMDISENSLIRPILNYPNYNITQSGRVWVKVRYGRDGYKAGGRWLKPFRSGNAGHLHVELCKNGVPKAVYVHRLVLEAFVGPCPEGMECRHLDGNSQNNELENLRWGTRKENVADRKRHGTSNCGERQGRAKLTESKVNFIRTFYNVGFSYKELSELFNVSYSCVYFAIKRYTWRHIK